MSFCSEFDLEVFLLSWFSIIWDYLSSSLSFCSWSLPYYYSASLITTPFLLSTSIFLKILWSGPIICLSVISYARHLFSSRCCYFTPAFPRFLFKARCLTRHFQSLAYKCITHGSDAELIAIRDLYYYYSNKQCANSPIACFWLIKTRYIKHFCVTR